MGERELTAAPFDQRPMALEVMDEWLANIRATPDAGIAANRPGRATDACFDTDGSPMAAGDEVWAGMQASYANMARDAGARYGVTIEKIGAIGVSAMMHGYLAFDKDRNLLTPFRTWRNNTTGPASEALTA